MSRKDGLVQVVRNVFDLQDQRAIIEPKRPMLARRICFDVGLINAVHSHGGRRWRRAGVKTEKEVVEVQDDPEKH